MSQPKHQQLLPCRRKATTTTARLVIFSFLLATHLTNPVAAQDPQVAALAAPSPAGGGPGVSSSILDQFSPNCSAVTHIFQSRGIDASQIPQKPSNERNKSEKPPENKENLTFELGDSVIHGASSVRPQPAPPSTLYPAPPLLRK